MFRTLDTYSKKEDYEKRMGELEVLYKGELANADDKKKQKDIDKLYQDNKDDIDRELNRLKSIIADLASGSTILESDYRNIFCQFFR